MTPLTVHPFDYSLTIEGKDSHARESRDWHCNPDYSNSAGVIRMRAKASRHAPAGCYRPGQRERRAGSHGVRYGPERDIHSAGIPFRWSVCAAPGSPEGQQGDREGSPGQRRGHRYKSAGCVPGIASRVGGVLRHQRHGRVPGRVGSGRECKERLRNDALGRRRRRQRPYRQGRPGGVQREQGVPQGIPEREGWSAWPTAFVPAGRH